MLNGKVNDIARSTVTLTVRTLVLVVVFLIGIVSSAVYGYFQLDAKADAGVVAKNALMVIQCDIRQLKNFMLYSIKPDPQFDRCDP